MAMACGGANASLDTASAANANRTAATRTGTATKAQDEHAASLGFPHSSAGHWLLLPDTLTPEVDDLAPNGFRRLLHRGIRVLDLPDGSVRMAEQAFNNTEIDSLELPERLGGGILFTSNGSGGSLLWWAPSWLEDARPVATIPDRIGQVVAGFDRLYLQIEPNHELLALDIHSGKQVDLGPLPPGSAYQALAFVDDWFGAVFSDVLGLQATFDRGNTWHALDVGDADLRLEVSGDRILVVSGRARSWLSPDGTLSSESSADPQNLATNLAQDASRDARFADEEQKPPARGYLQPLGPRPIRDAVLYGWPLSEHEALVMSHGALGRVALDDGRLLDYRANVYEGASACPALALGSGVAFTCSDPKLGTRLYTYAAPDRVTQIARFEGQRKVQSSGNGRIVVSGSCGPAEHDADKPAYCVFDTPTQHREFVLPRADDGRVVALRDGRVVVVHPPGRDGRGDIRILDGDHSTLRALAAAGPSVRLPALVTHGTWLDGMAELQPGVLGAWVAGGQDYIGISVNLNGTIEIAGGTNAESGELGRTILAGPLAFEVSGSGVAWQTRDFGFHWQKLSLPRALDPYSPTDARALAAQAPSLGCSPVGCLYEPWVRIGFEASAADQGSAGRSAEVPPLLNTQTPGYASSNLVCYPAGAPSGIDGSLAKQISELEERRPRRGNESGYGRNVLGGSRGQVDIVNGAFRPFWSLKGPRTNESDLLLDMGHEYPVEFRSYAWGERGPDWTETGTWLVRVATRFGPKPVWSTAPTRTPWRDWIQAAEIFGANRSGPTADWLLALDPDETSGVLRITAHGGADLHWVEDGRVITSSSSADLPQPSNVVRLDDSMVLGVPSGSQYDVYRWSQRELAHLARFPINEASRVMVVRSSDAQRIAIWVHAPKGAWYLYPLGPDGSPRAPLVFSREQLNRTLTACDSDASGWLVRASLPLTRFGESDSTNTLSLMDGRESSQANDVVAKVLVNDNSLCLLELAATRSGRPSEKRPKPEAVGTAARIALTLRDPVNDLHEHFRCTP